MDQQIKQDWTTDLVSEEYEQTTGFLCTSEGYCCLGVLCELAVKAGVVVKIRSPLNEGRFIYRAADDPDDLSETTLPQAVFEWAGLEEENPIDPGSEESLAELNDGGMTFASIAQLINEKL